MNWIVVCCSTTLASEVFLGDGHSLHVNSTACSHCVGLRPKSHFSKSTAVPPTTNQIPTAPTTFLSGTSDNAIPLSVSTSLDYISRNPFEASPEPIRIRRAESTSAPVPIPAIIIPSVPPAHTTTDSAIDQFPIFDGHLDMNSNYTGFVEIIGKFSVQNFSAKLEMT